MDNRFKKLKWNSILGLCYQAALVITGLILPKFFLHYYGSEVNGLISSITQFLTFINICDLGISAVVSAAYYKPLAEGDSYRISQIFVYSKRFFRAIGIILLVYIGVLLAVYPTLINNSFGYWFTFALIGAMGLSQLGQYFIGLSYQLLINSDQRSYVQLATNGCTLILNTVISILLMVLGTSVQLVKLTTSLIYLMRPLIMYIYISKRYNIDKHVPVDKTVIPQKRHGIVQHIAYMVYENTDVIVLTVFSTLSNVSIYSIYTLVTGSIKQIVNAATTGVQSLIGNMIVRGEREGLKSFYLLYNWGVHTMYTILFTVTALLIVPFVRLYTSGVTDANYDVPVFAVLITVAYFLSGIRNCQYVLIRAAGHFKQTQVAALIEMSLNLITSIVLVFKFGLIGVAIGTIIATLFFIVYEMFYFSKNIVSVEIWTSVKQLLIDAIVSCAVVIIMRHINVFKESVMTWILQALIAMGICLAVSLIVQLIFYNRNVRSIFNKFKKRASRNA